MFGSNIPIHKIYTFFSFSMNLLLYFFINILNPLLFLITFFILFLKYLFSNKKFGQNFKITLKNGVICTLTNAC